jgi:hypothetical protein
MIFFGESDQLKTKKTKGAEISGLPMEYDLARLPGLKGHL